MPLLHLQHQPATCLSGLSHTTAEALYRQHEYQKGACCGCQGQVSMVLLEEDG
jgi:hypothetical protein